MIPIFQERYIAPSPVPNEHVAALLQFDGLQFLDVRNLYIDQAIVQLAEMIQNSVPRSVVSPLPKSKPFYRRLPILLILIALIAVVLVAFILPNLSQPLHFFTTTDIILNPTDTIEPTQSPEVTPTPSVTVTPAPTFPPSPTLEIALIVQTLDAQATLDQLTLNAQSTAAARATAYAIGTQNIIDLTSTASKWTATLTPTSPLASKPIACSRL